MMKIACVACVIFVTGCAADPPAPVAVPEPTTQSKVHCDLIFPAPNLAP